MTTAQQSRTDRAPEDGQRAEKRILISDKVVDECLEYLGRQPGIAADHQPGLAPEALLETIGDYHGLIVRSGTKVTAEVIEAATRLEVVGRAGTGIDNIDVEAATRRGIVVMNTPSGNTLAAAEHAVSLLMAMARNIPEAHASLARGEWRRGDFTGFELNRKVIGVLGFGRIGQEVARRALAFGMKVLAYDPFVDSVPGLPDVEHVTLEELYARSEIITVHMPLLDSTYHLLDAQAFAAMKPGVRVVNAARGGIVDEDALLAAIDAGRVAGAALDVFESEPPGEHPLLARPEVIATPHLGAATREAQERVTLTIAEQMVEVLAGGPARNAVNLPSISSDVRHVVMPYLLLAERLGAVLAQLAGGPLRSVHVQLSGEVAQFDREIVDLALYKGLLTPSLGDRVNFVNCRSILKERGVTVTDSASDAPVEGTGQVLATVEAGDGRHTVGGNLRQDGSYRLTEVDGYRLDATPAGHLIVLRNLDEPGVVGRIGTILGDHRVNIAYLTWGRVGGDDGTDALTVINIDSELDETGLAALRAEAAVKWAELVSLPQSTSPDAR